MTRITLVSGPATEGEMYHTIVHGTITRFGILEEDGVVDVRINQLSPRDDDGHYEIWGRIVVPGHAARRQGRYGPYFKGEYAPHSQTGWLETETKVTTPA